MYSGDWWSGRKAGLTGHYHFIYSLPAPAVSRAEREEAVNYWSAPRPPASRQMSRSSSLVQYTGRWLLLEGDGGDWPGEGGRPRPACGEGVPA